MIDPAALHRALDYDPETGVFRWRTGKTAGSIAGYTQAGYRKIKISGRLYYAHRLAWLYVTGQWPRAEIDHQNGDRGDNRIANLREASRAENAGNRHGKPGSSGFVGVRRKRGRRRWEATLRHARRHIHIGTFSTAHEAHAAYVAAARRLRGEFART